MPELPELEVMREVLEGRILGRPIARARAYHPGILKTVDPPVDALVGRSFAGVERRGKHLVLSCGEDLHVVLHLMLAGRLVESRGDTKITKATGFVFGFDDGEELRVIENGTRRRVRIHVVRDPTDVRSIASLGVEPLSDAFTVEYLTAAFDGLRRQLKKALTDQSSIAGIGTAYADEILYAAKLSPIRYVSTLKADEIERLHRQTRAVLANAIEEIRRRSGGNLVAGHARDFLRVYKRTGQPCPDCGTPIAEIRYAQKKTYYCPTCQSSGKTIADRRSWLTR
jgi:formamidopyrimidine-DNA glycosylase